MLLLDNKEFYFEVDTGSKISAVNKSFYDKHFSYLPIIRENNKFHSYIGQAIVSLGYIYVHVQYGNTAPVVLPLFIIENGRPPLLSRR